MLYLFTDLETTGYSPKYSEIISCAIYITDRLYNLKDEFYETATVGPDRMVPTVFGKEADLWPIEAQNVHGITWQEQLTFQHPIEFWRKMYRFMDNYKDQELKLVYHSNTTFDKDFLMYRSAIHAPRMNQYLQSRLTRYELDIEHSEHFHVTNEDNTMKMVREYIKHGKDTLKQATKAQKRIDKLNDMLTKDRKTPLKPEKIREYMDERASLENDIAILNSSEVQFDGVSLDKVCRALNIPLNHHDARSDAKALIPIHKFLSENL